MEDDSVVLLACAWEESWYIDERDDRNVERVAETNEAGTLAAGVNVEHTGIYRWLVGHDTYALTVEAGEADDDVACELWLYLEELAIVNNASNHLVHVVSLVAVVRDDLVESVLKTVDRVVALLAWCCLHIV